MIITTSAARFEAELCKWLDERIAKQSEDILAGMMGADVYKERVAHLRALREMRNALPEILAKAKD